jgi:hypothetical protein
MKQKLFFMLLLIVALASTACGRVADTVTDAVAERAAEVLLEQATGVENLEMNQDGDELSFSVQAESGERVDFSRSSEGSADVFAAMGFNIPLPAGLSFVSNDRTDQDGEERMAMASYELVGISDVALRTAVHNSLIEAGFTYFAFLSAETEADMNNPMLNYVHTDGYQFMLITEDEAALLSLIKTSPEAVADMLPKEVITELDGRMTPDKTTYAPGEEIRLTFVSNTALDGGAWVAIVPSNTPQGSEEYGNAAYLSYAYASDVSNDILILYAPEAAGSYDLRLYNAGLELASVSFSVSE